MKKAQTAADYLSLVLVLGFGTFIIMTIAIKVFVPWIFFQRSELKIESMMELTDSNTFFTGYLAMPVGNQAIADLISESYIKNNFGEVKSNTTEIITNTYGTDAGWKLFIDDKKVSEDCKCDSGKITYETILALPYNPNKNSISIKLRIYKNE